MVWYVSFEIIFQLRPSVVTTTNAQIETPVDETTHHLRPMQFLTLMAFHSFLSLKVDATVLEVCSGGAYDTTNMVPSPVATGITHLGLGHVSLLGETIDKIAWHKSGIFKVRSYQP